VYPYLAGSTYLHQVVPPWVKVGGLNAMVERLRAHEQRQRIRHDLEQADGGWANQLAAAGGWHNILIAGVQNPARRDAEGRRIADLAKQSDLDPLEYTLDLLIEDRGASTMVVFHMDEVDMRAALRWRWSAVGSDQLGVTSPSARVHPRAYGTFARVLGWGVREAQLFPLEEAVHKMTGLPAEILGLRDRGRITSGAIADLVLFDPSLIVRGTNTSRPRHRARDHGGGVRDRKRPARSPRSGPGAPPTLSAVPYTNVWTTRSSCSTTGPTSGARNPRWSACDGAAS
jgi:N-acyl-D-aspartate/D-glutamate deacylase